MDAFFAAIEERDNPQFKGLPIVVGADPKGGRGRGIVSTANYKAREYGIRSALPISKAWLFSEEAARKGKPRAAFLPVDFDKYSRVSEEIMAIIHGYSSVVEEASIDEAYLDLSLAGSYERAKKVCEKIKKEIKEKERITASIGIGPNKLIAKIASDSQKPDGLTIIGSDDETTCRELVERFLEPLSIRKIPGIGPKTEARFHALEIKTVKDLKKFSRKQLEEMLGKWGIELYEKVRGRDESPLQEVWIPKSIGEQETFEKDTLNADFIFSRLKVICQNVFRRFSESGFQSFRTITVTVRFADFQTFTRSQTLSVPTNTAQILQFESMKLLTPFLDKRENPKNKPIRLIGIRVEKLVG